MTDNFTAHGTKLKIKGSGAFHISVLADLRNTTLCKTCGKDIFFARTRKGKLMAIEHSIEEIDEEYVCHYNNCTR